MKLRSSHGVLAATTLAAALGAMACEQSDDPAIQTGFHTEAAVERQAADEELGSGALRQSICDAIVLKEGNGAHGGDCGGFTYTITEFARSTKYGHIEEGQTRPITMQMKVAVENPANGDLYDATLTRELNSKFELKFKAEIAETGLQEIHDYILQLADDAGEYGDWWDEEVQDKVRVIEFDALPAEMQTRFAQVLADVAEENQEHDGGAMYSGEMPFLEILMDGEVVGYVLNVDDYIDHSLWDGSGTHFYFDTYGTVIASVYWSG